MNNDMKREDWTKQLKDRLKDYHQQAPDDLWNQIEKSLPQQESASHTARLVSLRRWAVAAVVCLLFGGAMMVWLSKSDSDNGKPSIARNYPSTGYKTVDKSKQNNASDTQNNTEEATSQGNNLVAMAVRKAPNNDAYMGRNAEDINNPTPIMNEVRDKQSAQTISESPKKEDKKDVQAPEKKTGEKSIVINKQPQNYNNHYAERSYANTENDEDNSSNDSWSANLFADNTMNGMNMGNANSTDRVAMSNSNALTFSDNGQNCNPAQNVYLTDCKEETKHKQPISVGLSVTYRLNRRWFLESGVVYTKLTSDFNRQLEGNTLTTEQTLHYVGIPLKVGYSVWSNRHLNTYVTAGGQMDFNVSAKMSTEGTSRNIKRDRTQWSTNTSLGVQYNFNSQLGLFVEPGIKYYFNNGSDVQNFFKDKHFNFNLQLGFRFTLK